MASRNAYASCQTPTEVASVDLEVEEKRIGLQEAQRKTEIGNGSDRFRWNWRQGEPSRRTAVVRESDPALLLGRKTGNLWNELTNDGVETA